MKIKPDSVPARFLQALRAGRMEPDQIWARFKTNPGIRELLSAGYIAPDESGYKITHAGLAACPPRRSATDAAGSV